MRNDGREVSLEETVEESDAQFGSDLSDSIRPSDSQGVRTGFTLPTDIGDLRMSAAFTTVILSRCNLIGAV